MTLGITAYGGYVPRLRLSRQAAVEANAWFAPGLRAHAKGERAICNWDEDSLTLAVEAARDCLAGAAPADLGAVSFASTTHPFADRQNAGVLATALGLGADLATADVGGSQRAGTSGLLTALNALRATGGSALHVAADDRKTRSAGTAELLYGAGARGAAAAGGEGVIAEFLGGHQIAVDFVDHYRARDQTCRLRLGGALGARRGLTSRSFPRAIEAVLESTGVDAAPGRYRPPSVLPCVPRGGRLGGIAAKVAGIRERSAVRRQPAGRPAARAGTAHAPDHAGARP